jgi:hypothetical protein
MIAHPVPLSICDFVAGINHKKTFLKALYSISVKLNFNFNFIMPAGGAGVL